MKRIFFIVLFVIVARFDVLAQNVNSNTTIKLDSTNIIRFHNTKKGDGLSLCVAGYEITFGEHKNSSCNSIEKKRKRRINKTSIHMFTNNSLGFSSLISSNSSLASESLQFPNLNISKSIFFSTDIIGIKAVSNTIFTLYSGISLRCYNYTFADDITLDYQNGKIVETPIDASNKKSKLTTAYISLPISLLINITDKFYIAPGVYGGVNINAHTKYKRPIVKSDNFGAVNQTIAGASLKLNYDNFGVFADYSLTNIFKNGVGYDDIKAFTIGMVVQF